MIPMLKCYRDDVIALSASGHCTSAECSDIQTPQAGARRRCHETARFVYHAGDEFKNSAPCAPLADAGFGFSHLGRLGMAALITRTAWIANAASLFAPFFHVPLRIFPNQEITRRVTECLARRPEDERCSRSRHPRTEC